MRIAIPAPTSAELVYNRRSWLYYAEAITRSGGEPVMIDLELISAAEVAATAISCDGVCLPGSPADIDPHRYSADPDPATSPADFGREFADNILLAHAYANRKPILGICYGVQSLNVYRGGSLVQDIMPLPVNHSAGRSVAIAHTALIAEHSGLGQLLLATDATRDEAPLIDGYLRLPINSSHHQAVSEPGDGLRIVSRCPDDGVIEAIESDPRTPHFVLGVQWHPERSFDISPASRAIFARFIQEAASRHRP
ncbi:MAG TPA: gamma-glutamyl-gamma-aminobutyrate hydrolase family protein [Acidobacteriaceae bacterium]